MSVTYNWYDNNQRVLMIRFQEGTNWEDYQQAEADYLPQVREKAYEVSVIVDIRQAPILPPNAIRHISQTMHHKPANLGMVVVVGSTVPGHALWRVVSKIYRWSLVLHFADSIEEAYRLIQHKGKAS